MFIDLREGPLPRVTSPGQSATEAAKLLSRYPNVSEIDLARLIRTYRQMPAVEAALLISDDSFGPKLDRFFSDHRSKLRPPFRQYAVLVAIAVFGTASVVAAMVFGS